MKGIIIFVFMVYLFNVALSAAGVYIVKSPALLGETMLQAMKERGKA